MLLRISANILPFLMSGRSLYSSMMSSGIIVSWTHMYSYVGKGVLR